MKRYEYYEKLSYVNKRHLSRWKPYFYTTPLHLGARGGKKLTKLFPLYPPRGFSNIYGFSMWFVETSLQNLFKRFLSHTFQGGALLTLTDNTKRTNRFLCVACCRWGVQSCKDEAIIVSFMSINQDEFVSSMCFVKNANQLIAIFWATPLAIHYHKNYHKTLGFKLATLKNYGVLQFFY